MSLPGSTQSYSNLSQWRLARYQKYIASAEGRLDAVQAQLLELTASPVESYNFNAGDGGSQSATYRKMKELGDEEDRLIGATLVNQIETGGILTAMIQNEIPVRVSKRKLLEPHLSPKSLMF